MDLEDDFIFSAEQLQKTAEGKPVDFNTYEIVPDCLAVEDLTQPLILEGGRSVNYTTTIQNTRDICTTCNKPKDRVKNLISIPLGYICNECVELLVEMIADEDAVKAKGDFLP